VALTTEASDGRRRRVVVAAYPLAVYFTVIVTGTHFVIDGLAGMALTGLVTAVCTPVVLGYRRRRQGVEPSVVDLTSKETSDVG
jgi:hypothetical protein